MHVHWGMSQWVNGMFFIERIYVAACTKTRNTGTKPSEPPKPPKHRNETAGTTEKATKTRSKRSKQPQWPSLYWRQIIRLDVLGQTFGYELGWMDACLPKSPVQQP